MAGLPKVLIATPTFDGKSYCQEQFISNVMTFTYPRKACDFVIFDNSSSPDNAKRINQEYGVKVVWKDYSGMTLLEKLAASHEAIRNYALEHHFDYVLHLESDIFPEPDVIERLLSSRKHVIGVPYMLYGGARRRVITQPKSMVELHPRDISSTLNLTFFYHYFFDGSVKPVNTNGLGCTLISKAVLKAIPFRYEQGSDAAPDTWWTLDLMRNNIQYYVDTSMHAFHHNRDEWGEGSNLLKNSKTE